MAPNNIDLLLELKEHNGVILRIVWSPDGKRIATTSVDKTIRVWNFSDGKCEGILEGHSHGVNEVAWLPGDRLVSCSYDTTLRIWDLKTFANIHTLFAHSADISTVAVSPDETTIASGSADQSIRLWSVDNWESQSTLIRHTGDVYRVVWSPDGLWLASCSKDGDVIIWDTKQWQEVKVWHFSTPGARGRPTSVSWSHSGKQLCVGTFDGTVKVLSLDAGNRDWVLEGHTSLVRSGTFSYDDRLLATSSRDNSVRIWRTDTFTKVARIPEETSNFWPQGIAFHPTLPILATFGNKDRSVRIWKLNFNKMLGSSTGADYSFANKRLVRNGDADSDKTSIPFNRATNMEKTVRKVSAKLMLMGESNAGKSALALRLTEDRYEEQTSTHAMRIWEVAPERIHPDMAAPDDETRELVIWDLGGQQEYQLVHQLFLQDTHLALLLIDPSRDSEFHHLDAWCLKLEKQRGEKEMKRILVGAKSDEIDTGMIDRSLVQAAVKRWDMNGFYLTSAKRDDDPGITDLRRAIAAQIDWKKLSEITRPLLFQQIRNLVDEIRRKEVVILYVDLEKEAEKHFPEEFDPEAVNTVVEQLAGQGVLADTRLSTGQRALVLRISVVEKYAGSIVRLARDHSRTLGVPALELSEILCCRTLPGIEVSDRLSPFDERNVLECVVELMIDRGICLEQNRRLVFPTLFPEGTPAEQPEEGNRVSLYYDFSGAIDNIYASLIAHLAVGERFGRVRLWPNQAVYDRPGQGMCGLKRMDRKGGWAHLDLIFSSVVTEETRNLFTIFIEEHLREQGIEIREVLGLRCPNPNCSYSFGESLVAARIERGEHDIICPLCEKRIPISKGAATIRKEAGGATTELIALKKTIAEEKERGIHEAKEAMGNVFVNPGQEEALPVRLLHLSDLHFCIEDDPNHRLQPLLADLSDNADDFGRKSIDLLAITGDLTYSATAGEFEKVHQFINLLLQHLNLSPDRCIIVPGNHDLSWDENSYVWQPKRKIDTAKFRPGTYVEQGDGYLIRNDITYPDRFKNFGMFYHQLMQRPFPLRADEQFHNLLLDTFSLQFLGLNSAWEIDEYHKERSGIYKNALASALMKAEDDLQKARDEKRIDENAHVLRLVMLHHPVTGNEKITDDAFLERLRQAGYILCLHGHVHEHRADMIGYMHPKHLHVIGAGSFGAGAAERPEAMPKLYNLLEIASDRKSVRVFTRAMPREGGAFTGWTVWPSKEPHKKCDFYDISLR